MKDLKLVHIFDNYEYIEYIRITRNTYREYFIQQETISEETHKIHMDKNKWNYRVCVIDDLPIGFIGCVDGDIRLAVDEKFRNRNIGKFMLLGFMLEFPRSTAKVKLDNIGSQRLFESCGFTENNRNQELIYYVYSTDD